MFNTEAINDLIQNNQGIEVETANGTFILTPSSPALSKDGTEEIEFVILPREEEKIRRVCLRFRVLSTSGGEPVTELATDIIIQVPLELEQISNPQRS